MADGQSEKKMIVANTPLDLQRMKLEKLMKNPAKPVNIPEKSKEYLPRPPPEFIRNVWGSSAGAGSGDFHVYRGVRRREYARQKYIGEKAKKESLDESYHKKVEENKIKADEKTAKKRAKRLKKKVKAKIQKFHKENQKEKSDSQESGSSDGEAGPMAEEDEDTNSQERPEPRNS